MAHKHVVAGLAAALRAGLVTADAVALEVRKAADEASGQPASGDGTARPPSLTARRLDKAADRYRPAAVGDRLWWAAPPKPDTAQEGNTSS